MEHQKAWLQKLTSAKISQNTNKFLIQSQEISGIYYNFFSRNNIKLHKIYGIAWFLDHGAFMLVAKKNVPRIFVTALDRPMLACWFELHLPDWNSAHESHERAGKVGFLARTDSAHTVKANTWLQSALVVGSVWVHPGCETPPLTKNAICPRELWSPLRLPSVWIDSTHCASAELKLPIVIPLIGPKLNGSSPLSLLMMCLRLERFWTWRDARAIIWAPSENPRRFIMPEL